MEKLTRQEMTDLTREKILVTASDLFMRNGFLATSTRDIANACDLTQPSLYHHFKDKETLYVEVVKDLTEKVKEDMDEILGRDLPFKSILVEMTMTLIQKHPTNIFMMVNDINTEMSEENRLLMMNIWENTYLSSFENFIDLAMSQDKSFKMGNKKVAARYILSAISPLFNMMGFRSNYAMMLGIVDQTVHFILYGILYERP